MNKTENPEPQAKKTRSVCRYFCVALLLIQASLLAYISWNSSPNRTEIGHLGAAVYLWNFGKFDVFSVNPPLVRFVAGLPIALFCEPKYDWKAHSPNPLDRCEWPLGNTFVSINKVDDVRCYTFLARLACIPLVLLGGYVGFRFASELYGEWSGIMFQILWTFSPLTLGWGASICPDVAAASLGILGLYTFWHWLKTPSWSGACVAGVCLGLMLLIKTTWVIAFPLWAGIWFVWKIADPKNERAWKAGQLLIVFVTGLYFLNMGYLFDGTMKPLEKYQFYSRSLSGLEKTDKNHFGNRFEQSWIGKLPVPLPKDFVQGIDTQKRDFERGFESYLCGHYSDCGRWFYYLLVLALKEPIGTLLLGMVTVIATFFSRCFNSSFQNEAIPILPIITIFVFVSGQTGISMHPRYVIPVLPFFYIWISKLAKAIELKRCFWGSVVILCLLGMVGNSLYRFPYSLSYFNEFVGGPAEGGKYLLGSSVDWGQDEFELRDWIKNHPEAKPLYVTYQPSIPLSNLGIQYVGPVPEEPTEGWMILGVNNLYSRSEKHGVYHNVKPTVRIGWSIVIYQIKSE